MGKKSLIPTSLIAALLVRTLIAGNPPIVHANNEERDISTVQNTTSNEILNDFHNHTSKNGTLDIQEGSSNTTDTSMGESERVGNNTSKDNDNEHNQTTSTSKNENLIIEPDGKISKESLSIEESVVHSNINETTLSSGIANSTKTAINDNQNKINNETDKVNTKNDISSGNLLKDDTGVVSDTKTSDMNQTNVSGSTSGTTLNQADTTSTSNDIDTDNNITNTTHNETTTTPSNSNQTDNETSKDAKNQESSKDANNTVDRQSNTENQTEAQLLGAKHNTNATSNSDNLSHNETSSSSTTTTAKSPVAKSLKRHNTTKESTPKKSGSLADFFDKVSNKEGNNESDNNASSSKAPTSSGSSFEAMAQQAQTRNRIEELYSNPTPQPKEKEYGGSWGVYKKDYKPADISILYLLFEGHKRIENKKLKAAQEKLDRYERFGNLEIQNDESIDNSTITIEEKTTIVGDSATVITRTSTTVNSDFVEGLDDIDKFFEGVDPPDELDVAVGSSIQELLVGRTTKILFKRITMGIQFIRNGILSIRDSIIKRFKQEDGSYAITKKDFRDLLLGIWNLSVMLVHQLMSLIDEVFDSNDLDEENDVDLDFELPMELKARHGVGMPRSKDNDDNDDIDFDDSKMESVESLMQRINKDILKQSETK